MKSDIPFGFYNVSTGIKTSINELTNLILGISECELPIKYEPSDRDFVMNRVGDPTLAETELGFKAKTMLPEGIKNLIDWYNNGRG